MFRTSSLLGAAFVGCLFLSPLGAGDDKDFVSLFNGKDLTGWKTIVQGKGSPSQTFTVKDGVIVVSGKPNGYFYTEKSYKNYILRFDWKYIKDGNSGLLVHIQGKHKVWPKCVEVQGLQSDHGNIFPLGAKFQGTLALKDKEAKAAARKAMSDAQKKAIKKNDWNTTEVICKDGSITSKINGIQIDTGKGELTEGPFGLQSEGVELHFKNIKIKVLD